MSTPITTMRSIVGAIIPTDLPKSFTLLPAGALVLAGVFLECNKPDSSSQVVSWGFYFTLVSWSIYELSKLLFLIIEPKVSKHTIIDYHNKTANFIAGLTTLYLEKFLGLSDGILDLPEDGGLVIVANHPWGATDAMSIMTRTPRAITPIAGSHYNKKFFGLVGLFLVPFFELWGTIFVHYAKNPDGTKQKNSGTIKASVDVVEIGGAVLLFGKGELHYPDKLVQPETQPGAAIIAKRANEQLVATNKKPHVQLAVVQVYGHNPKYYGYAFGCLSPFSRAKLKSKIVKIFTPEEILSKNIDEITKEINELISVDPVSLDLEYSIEHSASVLKFKPA